MIAYPVIQIQLTILFFCHSRKINIAELLLGAIKKTRFEFPSCVSEGPTEFVFEKNVPVNDFLSYIADIHMGFIFFPGKIE